MKQLQNISCISSIWKLYNKQPLQFPKGRFSLFLYEDSSQYTLPTWKYFLCDKISTKNTTILLYRPSWSYRLRLRVKGRWGIDLPNWLDMPNYWGPWLGEAWINLRILLAKGFSRREQGDGTCSSK